MTDKINISNPEKILIPEKKIRKIDIANYLDSIADWILPHISKRPLAILRCPDGINKECFFQKKIENNSAIHSQNIVNEKDKNQSVLYIDSKAGLLALCQLGAIELHPWGTHINHYKNPDLMIFDLDPGPGVTFSEVAEASLELKDILESLELKSFLKVTGGKGLHVHVPLKPQYSWEQMKSLAQAICIQIAGQNPTRYLTTMSKSKRRNKIFLDYLRNGFGATAIATYGLRARKEAAVAMPIAWKDVSHVTPDQFFIKDVLRILKKRRDPWSDYFNCIQTVNILNQRQ